MFSTPDEESQSKAAALRPWVRRAWAVTAADFVLTLGGAGGLLAKDSGLLGGYHGPGTSLLVNVLFLSGPALLLLAVLVCALGLAGRLRSGAGHGFGWSLLGGLVLLPVSVLATLLALGLAAAG